MQIQKRIIQKELKYENVVVLKYHIEYPRITNESNNIPSMKFNIYNEQIAKQIQRKAENELYKEAVELYKYNKKNNYPIMVYEIYRTFEITLNKNNTISLYADEYVFTGGAHGTTTRTSQTWNMTNGRLNQNKEIYFEEACCMAIDNFNPQNFYLTTNGIVIYYQQYDIAPYSSGIRTFEIKQ